MKIIEYLRNPPPPLFSLFR